MVCDSCGGAYLDDGNGCPFCAKNPIKKSPSFNSEEIKKADLFSKSIAKNIKHSTFTYEKKNGIYRNNKTKSNEKNKKLILAFACIVLVIVSLFIFINKEKIFYSNNGKRTIMIYMIGSDLESKHFAASKDIDEILNSSIDYDDVNILIYTGGAKSWHNKEIPNNKHALFEIDNGVLIKKDEFDNPYSILDSANLSFLLNYGYENYDTEYYDLIFWDHGAGPIYGYGYDEYNKLESMSLIDIKNALINSPFNGANKLELIGFDACLMSSIEIASILSDFSEYMIASQEFEPGTGWDYSFLEKVNKNTSSTDFGISIIDNYYDYYSNNSFVNGVSLSLLKLNKVENVENKLDSLFSSIDYNLSLDFSSISRVRVDSKSFGKFNANDYSFDLVDFVDFLDKLPKKYDDKVSTLKSALSDLIIYQKTDLENTNGVSIYFPYENKKELTKNMEKYEELSFAPNYYKFLNNFVLAINESSPFEYDVASSVVTSLDSGIVSVTFPNEIINNYSNISYILFEKNSDNLFIPIYNGNDVIVDGNVVSTVTSNKVLVATNDEEKMNLTSIQIENGKDYTKYLIPGLLSKWDGETFEFEAVPVYVEYVLNEKQPDGFVSRILPMNLNENNTYSEIELELNDWDNLTFTNYNFQIVDDFGNYMKDWINSSNVNTISFYKGESIKISFENLDASHNYYCLFIVKDSKGNSYYSNITKVNKK